MKTLKIVSATVSKDGRTVHLKVDGLRELFVHNLTARGVRDVDGQPLLHNTAFYTLNQIP